MLEASLARVNERRDNEQVIKLVNTRVKECVLAALESLSSTSRNSVQTRIRTLLDKGLVEVRLQFLQSLLI